MGPNNNTKFARTNIRGRDTRDVIQKYINVDKLLINVYGGQISFWLCAGYIKNQWYAVSPEDFSLKEKIS